MVNPYKTPAAPEADAAPRLSLLKPARPETASALWFVGVSAAHFGLVALPSYLSGGSSLDVSPFFWLVFAAGLFFRLGPARRFILLIGIVAMATTAGGAFALLLALAMDSGIPADLEAAEAPSLWSQLLLCFALFAAFAYPVVVLWPRHVRDRFRDRLPVRNIRTPH